MKIFAFFLLVSYRLVSCYNVPVFINGRPRGGFVGSPHVEDTILKSNYVKKEWFKQRLDHFDASNERTWFQRYYVNSFQFKSPNSPVFLMVGGEGKLSGKWLQVGMMAEYANEHGALMFGLEHRFYGESHPVGDTSVSSLRFLNSEQALADLAVFQEAMTHHHNLTDVNKWIVFGGSYPGALSAWYRYKYPHMAYGAVASSAPIHAQLDFPEYLDISTESLSTDICRKNVKLATSKAEAMLKVEIGRKQLSMKFHTCEAISTKDSDHSQFISSLADNFFGVIQYNRDNRAWEGIKGTNITIETLCSMMGNNKLGDALERYAIVNEMIMKTFNRKCVDTNYDEYVKFMKASTWISPNAEGARQWTYQTCTEFGYYQTTDSKKQVFGSKITLDYFTKQCIDIFGDVFNVDKLRRAIVWTNSNYGGYQLAKSASRIIFPNGSIDPWHSLSFVDNEGDIIAIYIKGTAHCANMYPSSSSDIEELINARQVIRDIIKTWLK